jgi:hypothetical protein
MSAEYLPPRGPASAKGPSPSTTPGGISFSLRRGHDHFFPIPCFQPEKIMVYIRNGDSGRRKYRFPLIFDLNHRST